MNSKKKIREFMLLEKSTPRKCAHTSFLGVCRMKFVIALKVGRHFTKIWESQNYINMLTTIKNKLYRFENCVLIYSSGIYRL